MRDTKNTSAEDKARVAA